MKKFLLTLLFLLFANPIFAQTKPNTKTNINITIDTKTTNESLTKIKTNFTEYINTKLCNNKQKENINLIKDKPFENTICDSHTIGETYNCICDKNDSKYKNFYKSVTAITDFKSLTGTTINQFLQIKNFYDALDALPISSVNTFADEISNLIKQNENDKAKEEAERKNIIQEIINKLVEKINEEKRPREQYPDIVKDLEKNKGLKNHSDKNIQTYTTSGKGDINQIVENYLKSKTENKSNDDLQKLLNDIENEPEYKTAQDNINAIMEKDKKDKEEAIKSLKEELRKVKEEEANLINELGKTQTPNVKVAQINDTNFNDPNTNKNLNNALDKLIENKSPHPNKAAETNEEIQTDINNAKDNITKLNALKEKLEKEKNDLDKQLNDNYDKITKLLHEQNKQECKIFGQIDVIKGKVANYNSLSISGAFITCNGADEGNLNATKTLNQMFQITSLTEKAKWNTCLENKIKLLEKNLAGIEKNIPGTGPILNHINNIINKYPDVKELNCDFKCTNEAGDYKDWYNMENGTTKTTYKNKNGKTLEEQIKDCQLANFECKADDGTKLTFSEIPTSLEEANKLCETAKKENTINNFNCPNNITVDASTLSSIRAKMKAELTKNPQPTIAQITQLGNTECAKIQEQVKITQAYTDLINEMKKLQNYCCEGNTYRNNRCSRETNVNGSLGNHKITKNNFNIDPIINIMKSIRDNNMTCPEDETIINKIYETTKNTIYITSLGTPSNCQGKKKYIRDLYEINKSNNGNTSLNLIFKFCEWNG